MVSNSRQNTLAIVLFLTRNGQDEKLAKLIATVVNKEYARAFNAPQEKQCLQLDNILAQLVHAPNQRNHQFHRLEGMFDEVYALASKVHVEIVHWSIHVHQQLATITRNR